MSEEIKQVKIDSLTLDGGTQSRAAINPETVDEYAEVYAKDAPTMPPVVAFHDASDEENHLWLADGFQRVAAAKQAGKEKISCRVIEGTFFDAIKYSAGANATHGMPRSNKDKAAAIKMLLAQKQWADASDRWIAETAKVSPQLVGVVRASYGTPKPAKTKGKDGRSRKAPPKRGKKKKKEESIDTPFDGQVSKNGDYSWEPFKSNVRSLEKITDDLFKDNKIIAQSVRTGLEDWSEYVLTSYESLSGEKSLA